MKGVYQTLNMGGQPPTYMYLMVPTYKHQEIIYYCRMNRTAQWGRDTQIRRQNSIFCPVLQSS